MYSEGSSAVEANNETAFGYFKKASEKVNITECFCLSQNIVIVLVIFIEQCSWSKWLGSDVLVWKRN